MNSAVFVYHKAGELKVLDTDDARKQHDKMMDNGWVHTATLNPCVFIENLFTLSDSEIVNNVKSLENNNRK